MPECGAIILAAGLSRRMGKDNKLLLPYAGVPMIRHMVGLYARITTTPVHVVTGHQGGEVAEALRGTGARLIYNPDFELGQHTSVACGLRAIGPQDEILIGLGDQPLLQISDLTDLVAAHRAADQRRISIPANGNQRGNPILVPGTLHARLLTDPHAPGCKKFTRQHPEHVQFHTLTAQGFYADVDTPEAYAALPQHQPTKAQSPEKQAETAQ